MSDPLLCSENLRLSRRAGWTIAHPADLDAEAVLGVLFEPGEPLKRSHKNHVLRMDDCVVKRAGGHWLARTLRLSTRRARHRQGWLAAHRLRARGVGVPEPIGFAERRRLGVVFESAMVMAYLDGWRNVEQVMAALVGNNAGGDTIADFLARLAAAINGLADAGAYHADLSGKNIFTKDGTDFAFIDLDAIELDRPYDDDRRMKNHVQLYDSFCDRVSDTLLVPFISALITPAQDLRVWMPRVREGQDRRRTALEAKRARR